MIDTSLEQLEQGCGEFVYRWIVKYQFIMFAFPRYNIIIIIIVTLRFSLSHPVHLISASPCASLASVPTSSIVSYLISSFASWNLFNLPLLIHHLVSLETPSFSVRSRLKSNLPSIWSWFLAGPMPWAKDSGVARCFSFVATGACRAGRLRHPNPV